MKRVLITGASGFIGRSLSIELLNRGYIVTALMRKKSNLLPVDVNQIIVCDFNYKIDYSLSCLVIKPQTGDCCEAEEFKNITICFDIDCRDCLCCFGIP